MKKSFVCIASLLLALAGTFAQAQNLKLGFVDSQAVLEKLDEVKAANNTLQGFASVKEKELQKDAEDLRRRISVYQEGQKEMSEAMRGATEKELQAAQEKLQVKQQSMQTEIATKEKQLFEPIQKRIQETIKQVAAEGTYTYVFDKQVLFHYPAGDDLSETVVKKLQASKPAAATTPKPAVTTPTIKPNTPAPKKK